MILKIKNQFRIKQVKNEPVFNEIVVKDGQEKK